ncbi:hypothetical protein OIE68_01485 [Nocardia vinacea]|uniref:hypothetical protein n=1 Tax=Nocardia vinacea TaxID=96468 RepID=UPI002E10EA80|nr:hypothetical protein OIE68_01485 [Nocardia vinacea]
MAPDQWFRLWMTLGQVVGSGLVTFGTVWLGAWLALRKTRNDSNANELDFWVNELSAVLRRVLDTGELAETDKAAAETEVNKIWMDLLKLSMVRPTPRESASEVLVRTMEMGFMAGSGTTKYVGKDGSVNIPPEVEAAGVDLLSGIPLLNRVLTDTIELGQKWRLHGVSKREIRRALQTRSSQLGYTLELPDPGTGTHSKHGGWI